MTECDYDCPWMYQGQPLLSEHTEGYVGFVYEIHNLIDGRRYIGKKLLTSARTKQVKGKKKKVRVESDWKKYVGSNEELCTDVAKHGLMNFERRVLHLCKSKGECSYLEAKEQFRTDALLSPLYYNAWISVRVGKTHVKGLIKNNELDTRNSTS